MASVGKTTASMPADPRGSGRNSAVSAGRAAREDQPGATPGQAAGAATRALGAQPATLGSDPGSTTIMRG